MPHPPATGSGGWLGTVLLGVVVCVAYLANGREIGSTDTTPTSDLTITLLRGEGFLLDRFRSISQEPDGRLMPFVSPAHGHIVSRYPVGPALLALPLVAPQLAWWDWFVPGWDKLPLGAQGIGRFMTKNAAAVISALTAVLLYRVLRRMGLRRGTAWAATLAAALGSDLWSVASQALWQHGPAALALIAAVALLLPREPTRMRVLLAGLAAAALVIFRSIDVVLAIWLFAYVACWVPKRLVWFFPGPLIGGAALVTYNVYYFGSLAGGQARIFDSLVGRQARTEAMRVKFHVISGPWAGNLRDGALGTLLSPNRGLFVFSPWVALAILAAPLVWKSLRPWPVVRWMVWGLVPYFLVLSKYAVWWGGHCFGPRLWTDVIPLFAILFAFGLEWALQRARLLAAIMTAAVLWSVFVQAVGAFCYPSTWNLLPLNVDKHHERLWDWRDTELRRCLKEGIKPRLEVD
jgi:hypothetical protein